MSMIAFWALGAAFLLAAASVVFGRHVSKRPNPWVTAVWVLVIGLLAVFLAWANYTDQVASESRIRTLGEQLAELARV